MIIKGRNEAVASTPGYGRKETVASTPEIKTKNVIIKGRNETVASTPGYGGENYIKFNPRTSEHSVKLAEYYCVYYVYDFQRTGRQSGV